MLCDYISVCFIVKTLQLVVRTFGVAFDILVA